MRAYKFCLQPSSEQLQQFAQTAGCVRLVWNKALALEKERLDQKLARMKFAGLCRELTRWKQREETCFLKLVHSQPLQQVCKDLDRALTDGLKKEKGFPRFKKKGIHDSFRYPQGFKVKEEKIFLPKLGWVKFRKSQEIEGIIKNVTISKRAGHWYASVQVEAEIAAPTHPKAGVEVGIDMGVVQFATLSDGQVVAPHGAYKKYQGKLIKAQRKIARQEKGSKNRGKQICKVQRIHKKISDIRLDYLHKTSTWIAKNHSKVMLEDLKVASMSRSAKGTVENPGKNVSAKSGLNKSILDQGWFEFKRQLIYKLQWLGGEVVLVNPRYTSQRCHACGASNRKNRKSQARFECVSCGHYDHADHNAALNILAAGHAVSACGNISSIAS